MRTAVLAFLLIAIVAGAVYWTQRASPPATAPSGAGAEQPLDLPPDGARFTMNQRTDADVPGSGGRLRVHLGDITHRQVELSLHDEDGRLLIAPTSVHAGDQRNFSLGATRYHLAILQLKNSLVGTDTAELEVSAGRSQRERIEALLQTMAKSQLTFLRNGNEYDGAEAADHLRRKWEYAGDRVRTAEQFIDVLGSQSSMSGKAYQVRLADGALMDSRAWLTARLREQD